MEGMIYFNDYNISGPGQLSVLGQATGWKFGFDSWKVQQLFSSSQHPDRLWDPPCLLFEGFSFWVKRQEVNLITPSSAEIKNGVAIPPLPTVTP
jgi:hypothetical protein